MRRAARKDANQAELVSLWRMLGGQWVTAPPLDGWACIAGNKWVCVEVKIPARQGKKYEYTDAQQRFINACRMLGGQWWTWRTANDVLEARTK